jgi:pimeloyl-ACP methyl ester carboxylesterase
MPRRAETPFALTRPDGRVLRGRFRAGPGALVAFLSGFRSVHTGQKATSVAEWAATRGHACLRFDYLGHGASDGAFADFLISEAVRDAAAAVSAARAPGQPVVLVGSSMGGWIALLMVARGLVEPAGMVLVAPAVDFVSRRLSDMPLQVQERLAREGIVDVPDAYAPGRTYPVTRAFLADALALEPGGRPMAVPCPVRILHGTLDADVPVATSRVLVRQLPDAVLTEVPGGDHRLSDHLDLVTRALEGLVSAAPDPGAGLSPKVGA